MSTTTPRYRRRSLSALIPIGLYLFLSVLYLFTVPSGESPDEPSHLQCIEQVSIDNRLPEIDPIPQGEWWSRTHTISGYLCHHLPLFYVAAGYLQRATHLISGAPLHFEFPPNNPAWGRSPSMFLHTDRPSFFSIPEPLTVLVVRVMSLLLGLAVIWAAYRVGSVLMPDSPGLPVVAATLCAGWPQFLFMQRAINNDTLATALAVTVLIVLLDIGRPYRFVLASILACLAILAKLTMVFSLAVVASVFLLEFAISRERRGAYLVPGLLSAGAVGLLAGLLLLQPTLNQHISADRASFGSISGDALTPGYWSSFLQLSLSSGFARFGWMNVPAPDWQAYVWWACIAITGIVGLRIIITSRLDRRRQLMLIVLGIWVLAVSGSYIWLNLNRFQPQFRFAFPILPVISVFSAIGYLQFSERAGCRYTAGFLLLIIALILINLYIIFGVIGPAYAL